MGAKEELLSELTSRDESGAVRRAHKKLIAHKLKWKGPSNSETLLYLFKLDGKEIGVAAIRHGIFSFPATFWQPRASLLNQSLDRTASHMQVDTQPAVSSSQYSAGQIRLTEATIDIIEDIIETIIIPEAKRAGAKII
nr:hypothetical protein [Pseudomonas alcaliphila]